MIRHSKIFRGSITKMLVSMFQRAKYLLDFLPNVFGADTGLFLSAANGHELNKSDVMIPAQSVFH